MKLRKFEGEKRNKKIICDYPCFFVIFASLTRIYEDPKYDDEEKFVIIHPG
ncbi:hypothetical protein EDD80_102314 [Anseongella ginsenosidimutans]|uniref:Uncharacterized protein n=1 Tax=Anseongella ginsenosidimutans TaxID=496056 RepID=A0A4R3KVI7_9SPHI|nr:hypothetical protein EDD80_102314 [Anseongella ginsenosidimutans]